MNQVLTLDQIVEKAPSVAAKAPHSGVSARYKFMDSLKVLKRLYDNGFYARSAMQNTARKDDQRGHEKHLVRLRHESVQERGGYFPEVVMINSHDRTSGFSLMFGMFRLVCSNGMVVGNTLMGYSRRHLSGLTSQGIRGIISRFGKMSDQITEKIERMRVTELSHDERIAYANRVVGTRIPSIEDQIKEYAERRSISYDSPPPGRVKELEGNARYAVANQVLKVRRPEDGGKDVWSTLNVVQENFMRGFYNPLSRRRGRPINNINQDIEVNTKVWSEAEKLIVS